MTAGGAPRWAQPAVRSAVRDILNIDRLIDRTSGGEIAVVHADLRRAGLVKLP